MRTIPRTLSVLLVSVAIGGASLGASPEATGAQPSAASKAKPKAKAKDLAISKLTCYTDSGEKFYDEYDHVRCALRVKVSAKSERETVFPVTVDVNVYNKHVPPAEGQRSSFKFEVWPGFRPLHSDPRWKPFLRKMNFPVD